MKALKRSLLPVLIASVLAAPAALAQDTGECVELEGAPPGLYAATDEGRTFLIQDDKVIELGPGEAGFADESGIKCIKRVPVFLDWPCSTDAAQSRKFSTYTWDELGSDNPAKEVVQRYFEIPEVIEPVPNWVDGEFNARFDFGDIVQFSSKEFWYHTDPSRTALDEKRPKVLLVSLFVGINQVVLDNNMAHALENYFGDEKMPVVFLFNDSNSVPVSYFGPNVSLEELLTASVERGIKLAPPPLWWLGDYHLAPTIQEFEKFFEIPALEEIPQDKQAKLRAELEANGFSKKPIFVSLFQDTGTMGVDQPQRVRMAAEMGISRIPTVMNFIEPDMHLARCGPGTPLGAGTISGQTTPPPGVALPPTTPVVPPPPEPEVSDS